MKIIFCLLCVALGSVSISAERAMTVRDLMREGVPYGGVVTPECLQSEDVDRWARMIDADEVQQQAMQSRYLLFVEHHNEFMQSAGTKYMERAADLGMLQSTHGTHSPEYIEAAKSFVGQTVQFQQQLERLENTYIDSLVVDLSDPQVERLYVLRNEASRRQARSFPFLCRWANVDLRLVWEAISPNEVNDMDRNSMERVLTDYEDQITPLLDRASKLHWSAGVEMATLSMQEETGALDAGTVAEKYDQIWSKYGNAFQRVREVTEQSVDQAAALLSAPVAERFVEEAHIASFPELYPDRMCYKELFLRLLTSEEFSPEDKKSIEDMRVAYVDEYRASCAELESMCVQWGDQRSRGVSGYQSQLLRPALEPLLRKREAVSVRWLQILKDEFGEATIQNLMPAPRHLTRTPAQVRATSAGTLHVPTQERARAMPPGGVPKQP